MTKSSATNSTRSRAEPSRQLSAETVRESTVPGAVADARNPGASAHPQSDLSSERADAEGVDNRYARVRELMAVDYDAAQLALIDAAFRLARDAHAHQKRRTGEPYITHPLSVARIVHGMGLDHQSVMAALMHDVLEDTAVDRSEIVAQFGEDVACIVDGLSKLNHLEFRSKEEAQAASFQKMVLAMVDDIRVILVKLADRLHNMRTIGAMPPAKQHRIGRETLDIYAPIADRLGMYTIKRELEDLAFAAAWPKRARVFRDTLDREQRNQQAINGEVEQRLREAIEARGLKAEIRGRRKHPYSIYRKINHKLSRKFHTIADVHGVRVIVDDIDNCYLVLGIAHQLYKPQMDRFKDYIALPKNNGYQSLHTNVMHPKGSPVEIQIRTRQMDEQAAAGVAAHWAYKQNDKGAMHKSTRFWFNKLRELEMQATDSSEFVENVKVDLSREEIYVFTPKGDIITLPQGGTPVDFAYGVHSQIGDTCVAARVDGVAAPLSRPLESGQVVQIMTGEDFSPTPMWLDFVVSARARAAIRNHLRNLDRKLAGEFGRRLLRRALDRYEVVLAQVPQSVFDTVLAEYRIASQDELYERVGLGYHVPSQVAERVTHLLSDSVEGREAAVPEPVHEIAPLVIEGREGSVLFLARCCSPIPGDSVQGVITPGKGVAVHRVGCINARRYSRRARETVKVVWGDELEGHFEVIVQVRMVNQPGALARVTTQLSLMKVNIEFMNFQNRGEDELVIQFALSVQDRVHLARIVRKLRGLTVVKTVRREP